MKKIWLSVAMVFFTAFSAQAVGMKDFEKYFTVDLEAPLPDLKALSDEFDRASVIYDPRYLVSWDMGPTFDPVWAVVIKSYGGSEVRLKRAGEDDLYEMIMATPKAFYPYLGPYFHTLPGISDKILMMPGIKETKNTFPQEIAPQLQGIEDLEFLSPHLYILLMPQMWPSNQKPVETPRLRPAKLPKNVYNPDFFANVLNKVPDQGFGGAARAGEIPGPDRLRTLKVTKTSPLTGADVKAFLNTVGKIRATVSLSDTMKIIRAGQLLDFWESKNGTALDLNGLKDMVNPCQRLALKVKWAGLENEFTRAIAADGFNLEEWAYTCDKTVKAYRIARVSSAKVVALKQYKAGMYDAAINAMNPRWRDRQYATMQSLVEMHKAPQFDVLTALKNEKEIHDALAPLGGMLVISPIVD